VVFIYLSVVEEFTYMSIIKLFPNDDKYISIITISWTVHPCELLFGYWWLYAFWRSMSFKVIDFCFNWKPMHDFLLVINCNLTSISHHFQDAARSKPNRPILAWAPDKVDPSEFLSQTYHTEWGTVLMFSVSCMILVSVVLSLYTRITDRKTTHYDYSQTLQCKCNVWIKTEKDHHCHSCCVCASKWLQKDVVFSTTAYITFIILETD